jgi:hypothetical protein
MYISTVHLLSTLWRTPGFEPGTVGFVLGLSTAAPPRLMDGKHRKITIRNRRQQSSYEVKLLQSS